MSTAARITNRGSSIMI